MSFFEQTAETEMFWDAVEVEEVLDTVLPVKADKEDVVVGTEVKDNTILRDLRTFCFISQGLFILHGIHCMGTIPKWCRVHAISTRYATVSIVYCLLSFFFCHLHKIENLKKIK